VSIDLPGSVEEQLRTLAARQGRDVRALVEEALRLYLEAAAITDVDANELAEAQGILLSELPHIPDWKPGDVRSAARCGGRNSPRPWGAGQS
jgi:hypothetical protein